MAGHASTPAHGDRNRSPVVRRSKLVEELRGVREIDGALLIGSTTRIERLARDPLVLAMPPRSHRRRAGSAHGPSASARRSAAMSSTPARPRISCPRSLRRGPRWCCIAAGRREVPIAAFYPGYKQMDLAPHEMLVEIRVPALPGRRTGGLRQDRPAPRPGDREGLGAAVRLTVKAGRIAEIAIAAGSVAPTVVRLPRTEARAARGADR